MSKVESPSQWKSIDINCPDFGQKLFRFLSDKGFEHFVGEIISIEICPGGTFVHFANREGEVYVGNYLYYMDIPA